MSSPTPYDSADAAPNKSIQSRIGAAVRRRTSSIRSLTRPGTPPLNGSSTDVTSDNGSTINDGSEASRSRSIRARVGAVIKRRSSSLIRKSGSGTPPLSDSPRQSTDNVAALKPLDTAPETLSPPILAAVMAPSPIAESPAREAAATFADVHKPSPLAGAAVNHSPVEGYDAESQAAPESLPNPFDNVVPPTPLNEQSAEAIVHTTVTVHADAAPGAAQGPSNVDASYILITPTPDPFSDENAVPADQSSVIDYMKNPSPEGALTAPGITQSNSVQSTSNTNAKVAPISSTGSSRAPGRQSYGDMVYKFGWDTINFVGETLQGVAGTIGGFVAVMWIAQHCIKKK